MLHEFHMVTENNPDVRLLKYKFAALVIFLCGATCSILIIIHYEKILFIIIRCMLFKRLYI